MHVGIAESNNRELKIDRLFKPISPTNSLSRKADGIIHTDAPNLSYVNDWVIEKLSPHLRAQTAECVMDTFGISINTWKKMKRGLPIRRSVAERLLDRVEPYL